jgi:acylphosphatase
MISSSAASLPVITAWLSLRLAAGIFLVYLCMTSRAHLFFHGRVQGVFYRAFVRNQAARLGIRGWVRNLHDGRVEAVLEGNRELIEEAIAACRKGPSGAHVDEVEQVWETPSGEEGFEIRY